MLAFGGGLFVAVPLVAQTLPANSKLLITSVRTGNTDVFWIDPATGDAFNITKTPNSEERYPCWSPDGKRVVFTSNRASPPGTEAYNLYLANADGSGLKQLTFEKGNAVCYFTSWAGPRIYFGLDRANGKPALIGRIDPDGENFTEIAEARDPNISPDGKKIAYTERVGKGFCVFVMDADGKNRRQLTAHENEIGAVTPVWSSDGKRICYSDQVGEALELFVCDADGKNQKQLTKLGKVASSSAWSPDGKFITFRVTDEAYWRNADSKDKAYREKLAAKRPVWVMNSDGSDPRIIEVLQYQSAIDGSRPVWQPK